MNCAKLYFCARSRPLSALWRVSRGLPRELRKKLSFASAEWAARYSADLDALTSSNARRRLTQRSESREAAKLPSECERSGALKRSAALCEAALLAERAQAQLRGAYPIILIKRHMALRALMPLFSIISYFAHDKPKQKSIFLLCQKNLPFAPFWRAGLHDFKYWYICLLNHCRYICIHYNYTLIILHFPLLFAYL